MRRSDRLRKHQSIDYQIYDKTGDKVIKELSTLVESLNINESTDINPNPIMSEKDDQEFLAEYQTVSADIMDFIDENQIDSNLSYVDLKENIERIEKLRSTLRNLHVRVGKLYKGDQSFESQFDVTLKHIKQHILDVKAAMKELRQKSNTELTLAKEKDQNFVKFLTKDLETERNSLLTEMTTADIRTLSDEALVRRNSNIQNIRPRLKDFHAQVMLLMEHGGEDKSQWYEQLLSSFQKYTETLNIETDKREIEKHKLLIESNLNIKLQKFKGYNSSLDIFTFREKFEKFHLRTTPKHLLSDLLKNNYLEDTAKSLVKDSHDIDDIWRRLTRSFGDPQMMLIKRFNQLEKLHLMLKTRDNEKIIEAINEVVCLMKDLMSLAKKHSIEARLYNSNGLEKVYKLIGENRTTRWLSISCEEERSEGEALWLKFISFLEKEIRIHQEKLLIKNKMDDCSNDQQPKRQSSHHVVEVRDTNTLSSCSFCGESNHVATNGPGNSKIIQYFVCKRFVEMSPRDRFLELKSKGFCFQCLYPGATMSQGKHKEGRCQHDFTCQHEIHNRYPTKKHVLVCDEHKDLPQNQQLLQKYKEVCILRRKLELPTFAKEIGLHLNDQHQSNSYVSTNNEAAIYQLQNITVNNKQFLLFFDTGCSDFVSRYDAITKLQNRSTLEYKGSIKLGGVGGATTESSYGMYSVSLPLYNELNATFTGACLEKVTATFPIHHLNEVEADIQREFTKVGGTINQLPRLPKAIGGDVDFIIGIKYLRYHPEKVFQLPSGLTIYQSMFRNSDGSRGVIGGPHRVFNQIASHIGINNQLNFINNQLKVYQMGYQLNPDVSILGFKDSITDTSSSIDSSHETYASKLEQRFNESESSGSIISYRCIKCRSCQDCKHHDITESISIQEEVEQNLIDNSIIVDIKNHQSVASLPLIYDPIIKLNPNKTRALKVYQQQANKLSKFPNDKQDVIASERKLQELGHVDFISNLSTEQQQMLRTSPIQNFIPWRAVWKANSISTPCRLVFDASQPTSSGFSLNQIIAKGRNNMNKLIEIIIRWSMRKIGYHTDVRKMYNTIKLVENHWCLQRYLWDNELNPSDQPKEKIIKTLIYGVKSSGNQAERALRQTSFYSKDTHPRVHQVVSTDVYVDDCISGESSLEKAMQTADQLEIVLNKGGFSLKGFTFSGKDPSETLSSNGETIAVGGMLWYPKIDKLSLDVAELNFAKKQRGKKPAPTGTIPSKLTRRHCISKVSEIFDPTGKLTPITAGLKLDLHELVTRNLQWDDIIPDSLRPLWTSNFDMMQEIKHIRFRRTFVPDDATSLEITTLDFGDASTSIACAAIYSRIPRRNGEYSTQLVFSRSKLISTSTTQPRAELIAAVLNTHTGEVVKRAFQHHHKRSMKLTDSQVVLHWISNGDKALKQWVRNRVIEIQRFTSISDWYYINTTNMLADLGTRGGVNLHDVNEDSTWFNGQPWMNLDETTFPVKKVSEIILTNSDLQQVTNESQILKSIDLKGTSNMNCNANFNSDNGVPDEVRTRYTFSNYLIDPNKFRFKTVVRILATVIKYINLLRRSTNNIRVTRSRAAAKVQPTITISDDDIKSAEEYFYRKATMEVKHFVKPSQYERISEEVNGILYYSGRFLQTEKINFITPLATAMYDLQSTSFFVPIIDKQSPLAYSIISEVHWHNETVKHAGNESILRFVMKKAYILEGREIIKKIKRNCIRCRHLKKKTVSIEMGKLSSPSLTVAPAFYFSQIDLAGPLKAYCNHNKRSTIKVWMAVFCCVTTSATSIKIMDDYSTTAFVQAFVRFASQFGYPKKLFIDSGSQLIKGCEELAINFKDLQTKLHRNHSIDFEVCPVGAHNYNGKVERKIKEITRSVNRTITEFRLSVLQWETVSSEIANSLNNMPLALGNVCSSFEAMDLITPNRLLLGRNNERCPIGPVEIPNNFNKIIETNSQIFNSWFQNWLVSHVPKLVSQPKWFKSDRDLKEGDVVLFLKHDSACLKTYQMGMVKNLFFGKDKKVRKVNVEYANHNESIRRETIRSVRDLVIIHSVDELDIMDELNAMYNKDE